MSELYLVDGPCAGAGFDPVEGFGYPQHIRVVSGGKHGPVLLDLPEDEPKPGEQLHHYELASKGFWDAGRRGGMFATYRCVRSAPDPSPSLFESELRDVSA